MRTPSRDGDRALPRKRGRSVPAVYGAVSLVLVVGAVTFALSTPPPSTPPLAAVAPAPQEQLEVERVEQSSRFGEGAGGEGDCVPGDVGCAGVGEAELVDQQDAPGPHPAGGGSGEPDVVETRAPGQLRRCVNGPGGPRQTEDPQSPPCEAEIFSGDNGGATTPGVTATEIRVAVPWWGERQDDELALARHFNERYELYGRRLVLDFLAASEYPSTPDGRRAQAKDIAGRDVFASLGAGFRALEPFHDALAGAGVVSTVPPNFASVTEAFLSDRHPHVWSVYPTGDDSAAATGALVCRSLVGRPARHAGPDLRSAERVFGVLAETERGVRLDPQPLSAALELCDAPFHLYERDRDAADADSSAESVLHHMQADGVTTVICLCHNDAYDELTTAAEGMSLQPEWLHPGLDDEDIGGDAPRNQRSSTFGLTPGLRRITWLGGNQPRNDEQYWFTAMREADPQITPETSQAYDTYSQLLVLASGIQSAGPDLTPRSFGDGLTSLRFPNPGVGQAPWWQPSVGFGPGDHAFHSDFALFWWRNEPAEVERVRAGSRGDLCYVGDGVRYTAESVPPDADDLVFDPEAGCR